MLLFQLNSGKCQEVELKGRMKQTWKAHYVLLDNGEALKEGTFKKVSDDSQKLMLMA